VSWLLSIVPLGIAALAWWGLAQINRRTRLLRIGELIFWDGIVLVLIYLVWLRWF